VVNEIEQGGGIVRQFGIAVQIGLDADVLTALPVVRLIGQQALQQRGSMVGRRRRRAEFRCVAGAITPPTLLSSLIGTDSQG
jgi:hypothetical protein